MANKNLNLLFGMVLLLVCGGINAQSVYTCAGLTVSYNGYDYGQQLFGHTCWMTRNLRTTAYADGTTPVPFAKAYEENASYIDEFGLLYSWYSAVRVPEGDNTAIPAYDTYNRVQGACPTDWVLPNTSDYHNLIATVGGTHNALADSDRYWLGTGLGTSPADGLRLLPGGCYNPANHRYENILGNAYYWTSEVKSTTMTSSVGFYYGCPEMMLTENDKHTGYSVRCMCILPEMTLSFADVEATALIVNVSLVGNGSKQPSASIALYKNADYSDVPMTKTAYLSEGNQLFTFSSLIPNTIYYVKVKASNTCGSTILTDSITTACLVIPRSVCHVTTRLTNEHGSTVTTIDSVADHEGNWYNVVQIGNQCWLKENMRATTSPRHPSVSYLQNPASSISEYQAHCYYYHNNIANAAKYGVLYNWSAAMDSSRTTAWPTSTTFPTNWRGICPAGWHLPTDAEWTTMEQTVVNSGATTPANPVLSETHWRATNTDLGSALSAGCDWLTSNTIDAPGNYSCVTRNRSLFSALPSGGYNGNFYDIGKSAFFWNSTLDNGGNPYYHYLGYNKAGMYRGVVASKSGGSVRCMRNRITAPDLGVVQIDSVTITAMKVKVPIISTGGETPIVTVCAYTNSSYTTGEICLLSPIVTATQISGKFTGLTENTIYYVRIVATNSVGADTAVGYDTTLVQFHCPPIPRSICQVTTRLANEQGATVTSIDSVADHEGNWYDVVQIGNQCWLKENMRATTSPRHSSVTYLQNPASEKNEYKALCYYYHDSIPNAAKSGVLYNWSAAMDSSRTTAWPASTIFPTNWQGICPAGWHLPTDAEWTTMEQTVVNSGAITPSNPALSNTGWRAANTDLGAALSAGCDWLTSNTIAAPGNYSCATRNRSLFSAFPSGAYYGSFSIIFSQTCFWSATSSGSSSYYHFIDYNKAGVYRGTLNRNSGISVRCVRN